MALVAQRVSTTRGSGDDLIFEMISNTTGLPVTGLSASMSVLARYQDFKNGAAGSDYWIEVERNAPQRVTEYGTSGRYKFDGEPSIDFVDARKMEYVISDTGVEPVTFDVECGYPETYSQLRNDILRSLPGEHVFAKPNHEYTQATTDSPLWFDKSISFNGQYARLVAGGSGSQSSSPTYLLRGVNNHQIAIQSDGTNYNSGDQTQILHSWGPTAIHKNNPVINIGVDPASLGLSVDDEITMELGESPQDSNEPHWCQWGKIKAVDGPGQTITLDRFPMHDINVGTRTHKIFKPTTLAENIDIVNLRLYDPDTKEQNYAIGMRHCRNVEIDRIRGEHIRFGGNSNRCVSGVRFGSWYFDLWGGTGQDQRIFDCGHTEMMEAVNLLGSQGDSPDEFTFINLEQGNRFHRWRNIVAYSRNTSTEGQEGIFTATGSDDGDPSNHELLVDGFCVIHRNEVFLTNSNNNGDIKFENLFMSGGEPTTPGDPSYKFFIRRFNLFNRGGTLGYQEFHRRVDVHLFIPLTASMANQEYTLGYGLTVDNFRFYVPSDGVRDQITGCDFRSNDGSSWEATTPGSWTSGAWNYRSDQAQDIRPEGNAPYTLSRFGTDGARDKRIRVSTSDSMPSNSFMVIAATLWVTDDRKDPDQGFTLLNPAENWAHLSEQYGKASTIQILGKRQIQIGGRH